MPAPLSVEAKDALLADHRAGKLTSVPARSAIDYYRAFNASERSDVVSQARGRRYVLVTMDGEVRATDGVTVTRALPPADDAARDVAIDASVAWRPIPVGATVLASRQ